MTFGNKDMLNDCICLPNQAFACIYCELPDDLFQTEELGK